MSAGIKNFSTKSNQITILISVFLLVFSMLNCKKEEAIQSKVKESTGEIGIILTENTIMRLDPLLYSSVVTYIAKGEKVKILKKSQVKTWLGNKSDYWYMARYSKGFLGWIYGKNIKIFPESETTGIKKYLSKMWRLEMAKTRSRLKGLWSSIRIDSSEPEQNLIIYDDGKYISYLSEQEIIKGQYRLNYKDSEIIFSNSTFFGKNIKFLTREKRLYLIMKNGNKELQFKKITRKIENLEPDKESDKKPQE